MNVVLGAGLSGLSAAAWLTRAGKPVAVIEKNRHVGGLARTITHGDFHFDLGGHRFLTENQQVQSFVEELLGNALLKVPRKSRIYINGRHIDYPLSPANAVFGMGLAATGAILLDYGKEKWRNIIRPRQLHSLEDWVVSQFGRTIFNLYFKNYSEKVWGIDCRHISKDWVAKRIDGLSLRQFIQHSLKFHTQKNKTLTDTFFYPRKGIGQLSDRMSDLVKSRNPVTTGAGVERIFHAHGSITGIQFSDGGKTHSMQGSTYISSIPVTRLLEKIIPSPPGPVRRAAARIRFRSLVIVALFLNKQSMTDLTWMYFPGKEIPFGRIHEPKNWSSDLAPAGKSHIIAEYFCNRDDRTWQSADDALAGSTAHHLQKLGFFDQKDILDSCVLRIPYAYPVFDLHYRKHLKIITDFLDGFANLHLVGRSGMFSYLNMDQAMESGIVAAQQIIQDCRKKDPVPATSDNIFIPGHLLQPDYS
ncbi:MAG: FAD-dependent oxidoreductase [Desulfobulbaceae bacterium]|nr:FAD-dependent oxidoreductase [Desulfobulbaceae bacterium]